VDRNKLDTDGLRHSGKVAWRALAMLERELDGEKVMRIYLIGSLKDPQL
jgi:hypothetical protein